jgi:hypothetical protein
MLASVRRLHWDPTLLVFVAAMGLPLTTLQSIANLRVMRVIKLKEEKEGKG